MPASSRTLDIESIDEIIKTIRGSDKESLSHILKVAPERIHTVIPGMTILKTVAEYFLYIFLAVRKLTFKICHPLVYTRID